VKFKLKNAQRFEWKGLKGYSYNSKKEFGNASAAYFEVETQHGKVKNKISDRVYYILEGKGKFVINGKSVPVGKTDVVIVPKNTPYNYLGKMKLFLVHVPAFDARYEMKLR
jgi:mannose-6-phosphate isomerase-like protein (cupin superfamily)